MTPLPATLDTALDTLTISGGFPWLCTRLVPALYHITLLPADAPLSRLLAIAGQQLAANRLSTCLALGPDRAIYLEPDGRVSRSDIVPIGGTVLTDRLRLPSPLVDTPELRARRRQLQRRIEAGSRSGGTLFGDLTKGGHPAGREELERLAGPAIGSVPRGLERCTACGDWRGDCLDPDVETFGGMVMTVHCRCAKHNRCAACGDPLYERRLNANYFNVADGAIWHVPGFCGLSHTCAA